MRSTSGERWRARLLTAYEWAGIGVTVAAMKVIVLPLLSVPKVGLDAGSSNADGVFAAFGFATDGPDPLDLIAKGRLSLECAASQRPLRRRPCRRGASAHPATGATTRSR
jgi:hypothetical protein